MRKSQSNVFISLIIGTVIVIGIFLTWDYFKRPANECSIIMEQAVSSLNFNLGENNFHFGGKIEQKLNESVHDYAVKLKSCCIEHQAKRINKEQYLACRRDGERIEELKSLLASYGKLDTKGQKSLLPLIEKNISEVTGEKPNKPVSEEPQDNNTLSKKDAGSELLKPVMGKEARNNPLDIEENNFLTGLGVGIEKSQEQKNYDEFIKIQNDAQKSTGFSINPNAWMQAITSASDKQVAVERIRKVNDEYFSIVLPAAEKLLGKDHEHYKTLKRMKKQIKIEDIE